MLELTSEDEPQAYENALGIRVMEWSPSGHFLALGSYDDHLRVLGHLNWKPVGELDHQDLAVNLSRVNKDAVRLYRCKTSSRTD